ncbi:MAG: response regulator [Desulfobacteraceae bacterium]|nr:response regulator [Desulfobacteraceae bacterium]
MIIEPDPFFRPNLVKRLSSKEMRIFTTGGKKQAEKIIRRKKIDVVLLGLDSLKNEGLEFLTMIKRKYPHLEVITISAKEQIGLSIKAMKLGAFDDFLEPIAVDVLKMRILEAFLNRKIQSQKTKKSFDRIMETLSAEVFEEGGYPEMVFQYLETAKKTETNAVNINKEQIKVLLVDDEEEFVKSLAERIKLRKLKSDVALNGEEALRYIEDQVPDVMVLDLKMPGIDGFEVLRKVKKTYPQVQVIILTGHGSVKDEMEVRRIGAFGYLKKPTDINILIENIKRAYMLKKQDSLKLADFEKKAINNTENNKKDETF